MADARTETNESKKPVVVVVSGGFDPLHIGHVRMFQEAKKMGDKLVVILNNDNWLKKKKGYAFMAEDERKEIILAMNGVDEVVISSHPANPDEMNVASDLRKIRPDIFANGGDRDEKNAADPASSLYKDIETCKELGIKMVFNVGRGGKVQSSSWLVSNFKKTDPKAQG